MALSKRIFFVSVLGLILIPCFVFAQEAVEIHFFYGSICSNCAAEQKFLDVIEEKYPEVKINRYSAVELENQKFLRTLCAECDTERYLGLVPMTFVCSVDCAIEKEFFLGFDDKEGKKIENSIQKQLGKKEVPEEKQIDIPILGRTNIQKYSLPVLTIVMGSIDGLNVCSIGALIFILSLVLVLKSRRKILILGSIFIFTTVVVYWLLVFLWYQVFSLFSPFLRLAQILTGLLALCGGLYFFKQYLKFRKFTPTCEIGTGERITSKFSKWFQETLNTSGPKNILALIGAVLVFAVLITIIEFPCSAAFPVVYTSILAQANLSSFQYCFYICLYVFFYMIEELIIFGTAVLTMNLWLTSKKFVTWATLLGAIILTLLGVYYLFGIWI
jgi:hypothetical protein